MTKEEYLKWLETRGEPGTWNITDCRAADKLIKTETLECFRKKVKPQVPEVLWPYIELMVDVHFGSMETDNLFLAFDAYPKWMSKS